MSMIVQVQINTDPPVEVVEVRRVINHRELTRLDIELDGSIQYYEVTRFNRSNTHLGGLRQVGETTHVHHDPDQGALVLAYRAIEAVQEGETRDDAWLDAKKEADSEIEEVVETKDEFIGHQSEIIQACMQVFTDQGMWRHVPNDLMEELGNYV